MAATVDSLLNKNESDLQSYVTTLDEGDLEGLFSQMWDAIHGRSNSTPASREMRLQQRPLRFRIWLSQSRATPGSNL